MNCNEIDTRLRRIGQVALSTRDTLRNSFDCATTVLHKGVPGVFVECGVYAGSQCGAMALACEAANSYRNIHCFDSFRGFSKASEKDSQEWQDRLGVSNKAEASKPLDPAWGFSTQNTVQVVRSNLVSWGLPVSQFIFHEGWVQDTTINWDLPVALLRIDVDLYEPTRVCLERLYPFLQTGGICIMDDYALEGCREAADEYFGPSITPIEIGGGPVWWIKP